MDIQNILLAEISQNIKNLQIQLDYNRATLITALGGEPALLDGANSGYLQIGGSSRVSGYELQVDGDIITTDTYGAVGGKIISNNLYAGYFSPAQDAVTTLTAPARGGLLLLTSRSAHAIYSGLFLFNTLNGNCTPLVVGGNCSATKDTASKVNVYIETSLLKVQNKVAGTVYLSYTFIGATD